MDTSTATLNKLSAPDSPRQGRLNLWQRLTEPTESIQEPAVRRQTRFSSSLFLALALLLAIGTLSIMATSVSAADFTSEDWLATTILGIALVASLAAYALNRTSHQTIAAALVVGSLSILALVMSVAQAGANLVTNLISFMPLAFILGSVLLSARGLTILVVFDILGILSLPVLAPGMALSDTLSAVGILGTLGTLLVIVARHRLLIERDRLSVVETANQALQAGSALLERRSRDLALAAEVSRGVSQMRELEELLTNAVELIRTRFDLYYTQVYLVDPTRRTLVLYAGTGTVGAELLRRGHRLPIDLASINGTVASERRAIIVSNTANSIIFRPNPMLPDTRSEMSVPLIVAQRVVGVLDLQSAQLDALTDDNLPAFEAMASQLAVTIENAALFAEAEQARADVEAQARRLTQAGWREFLDAVNRSERLGYIFDQQALVPLTEPLLPASNPDALDVPIVVTGESIGRIQLERAVDIDRPWDPADSDLVSIVASRVANQVENLRLLAQAEQYRAEAVAAMRRLTREGWETLQTDSELAGYVYDRNEVRPVLEKGDDASVGALRHSLVVRDEPIGELAVDVDADDDEAAEIVAAVAEQLSGHIETLRLSFQMQRALATTQKQAQREQALRQITSAVRSSNDPATIMRTAVRELGSILGRKTVIQMATADQAEAASSNGQASDLPVGASPISVVGGKA